DHRGLLVDDDLPVVAFDAVDGGAGDVGRVVQLQGHVAAHLSVCRAEVHRADQCALTCELVTQAVAHVPHGGLGGGVRGAVGHRHPGRGGADVGDGSTAVGTQDGSESAHHRQRSPEVRVHLGMHQIEVAEQGTGGGEGGVVDEQVDVVRTSCGCLDGGRVGDVERDRLGPGEIEALGTTGGGVHLRAPFEELGGDV